MADKTVAVQPGSLLSAASTVVAHVEQSATPPQAAAPIPKPGSPVDAAAGAVAAGMQTKMAAMAAQLAPQGPALQATTTAGVSALQAQDGLNNDMIKAIPESMAKAASGAMSAGANLFSAAVSVGTGSVVAPMSTLSTAIKPMANVTPKPAPTPTPAPPTLAQTTDSAQRMNPAPAPQPAQGHAGSPAQHTPPAPQSAQLAGFGTGGPPPLKPAAPPKYPLDLSAIQRLAPGQPGPYGYMELVPGSGVWVPDPSVNGLHPGAVGPTAQAPLDLGSIVRLAPGALGPPGYTELVPHSGVWVPDPGSPGFVPAPPKFPLDLGSIVRLAPGALGPPGYTELVPHSGVWVPDPAAPR
jgi:hypothetical protein